MLSFLFLGLSAIGVWTGLTLMKKNPKEKEIKNLLTEMGKNLLNLIDVFIRLFENLKSLVIMLDHERKVGGIMVKGKSEKKDTEIRPPKLMKLVNPKN